VAESDVPVLVGHYRRHSPIIIAARDIITAGELGRLISVSLRLMFLKPDDYFLPNWRSQPGAGPVLTNLIHDIDALRFMCGEVASVQAVTSNAARGFAVEDTAAVILTLANGAIVTANLSDSIPSPYSWDLNAAEEPSFPVNGKDVYLIGGSAASLALPSFCLWSYGSERGWMKPLQAEKRVVAQENPYVRQCTHFLRVVRKKEPPSVTVAESTRSQMVVGAIAEAARTGRRVDMTFS
jgi:predicted dehydrogenase